MSPRSILSVVIGTAGHIDHGKSTLVQRLTGVDPDRLPEERERAMTIDLGFAPLVLPGGETVGLIDVPGHERFIKNMVAGASGIDLALLVVDTNEGVMPQTLEHLEIMELLGIERGLVALTKIDAADPELVELAAEELGELLAGTFLAGAPIVPVSAVSGEGIEALREQIARLCAEVRPRSVDGPFRMPIQRVFSARGFGTVVTGVPLSGRVRPSATIEIVPLGRKGRVRGVQSYGGAVEEARAGRSSALNLSDIDFKQVERGMVAAEPGAFCGHTLFEARFQLLARTARPLRHMAPVRVHAGTAEAIGRMALLEAPVLEPGASAYVQLRLREPLVVAPGDRFIVRDPAATRTLGGGRVLGLENRRLKPARTFVLERIAAKERALDDPAAYLETLLRVADLEPRSQDELKHASGLGRAGLERALEALRNEGKAVSLSRGGRTVHAEAFSRAIERVCETLAALFERQPLASTCKPLEVRAASGLDPVLFEDALEAAITKGRIEKRRAHALALPGRKVVLSDEQARRKEELARLFVQAGAKPPSLDEAAEQLGLATERGRALVRALARLLAEEGALIEVAAGLWFSAQAVSHAREVLLEPFRAGEPFSAARFRDRLGTTRKWAIPLLEYFDAEGLTERRGQERVLKRPVSDLG